MKQAALTIYIFLGVALIFKIGMTVYALSGVMHHNAVVAQLQTEKTKLDTQQQQLEAQLASQTSLASVLSAAGTEYNTIAQPIVITSATQLASQL